MEDDIEAFISRASEASSEKQLNRIFKAELEALGYQAFDAYRHKIADSVDLKDPINFVVASYDPGILGPYLTAGMAEMCPALLQLAESMTPFDYIEFINRVPENTSVQWQRRMLKTFMVRHAWCIPMNTISMLKGVTVYMAGRGGSAEAFQSTRHRIGLLSTFFMEALESFRPYPGRPGSPDGGDEDQPYLSSREIDCLFWAASGKSNPEIGTILTLSANTVRFHMKNAFRKLDVSSRVTAVDRAKGFGLI